MIAGDSLRPPAALDPTASAYKEWLHLNLFHHSSGAVGLVNVSLHGSPADPRSRALGVALMHVPGIGWAGQAEVRAVAEAAYADCAIALNQVAIAVDHRSGNLLASVRQSADALELRVNAVASAAPIMIENQLPLGHGWISWFALPRLSVSGSTRAAGVEFDLGAASAYHDHNWGRWFWGDDFGWEWGCFMTPSPGPVFVLSRTTDRAHRPRTPLTLAVDLKRHRWSFTAPIVAVEYDFAVAAPARRLPGAMAALHLDRSRPRVPRAMRVTAGDGRDSLEISFTAISVIQIVTADPIAHGYGFIHEIAGEFAYTARLGGKSHQGGGLAIFEYVD